jgi:hypothetical protein
MQTFGKLVMSLQSPPQQLGSQLERVIEAVDIHFPQNNSSNATYQYVGEDSGSEYDDDIVLNDIFSTVIPVLDHRITEESPQNPVPKLNYLGLLAHQTELCQSIANGQQCLANAFATINMMIQHVPQKRSIDVTFDIDPLSGQDKENRKPLPTITKPITGSASWMQHMFFC